MPPVRARLRKQATPSTFGSSKASMTIRWLAPRILIAVVTSPISSAAAGRRGERAPRPASILSIVILLSGSSPRRVRIRRRATPRKMKRNGSAQRMPSPT